MCSSAAVGLVAAALIVLVIDAVDRPGAPTRTPTSLGGDRGILATLVDETGRKLATVALTFGITGLAALVSPWVLLALPTFAWRFVGDNAYYWGTEWHYSLRADADRVRRDDRRHGAMAPASVGHRRRRSWSRRSRWSTRRCRRCWTPRRTTSRRVPRRARGAGAGAQGRERGDRHRTDDPPRHGSHGLLARHGRQHAKPAYVLFDAGAGIGSPADVVAYAEQKHGGTYELVYDRDGYVLASRR